MGAGTKNYLTMATTYKLRQYCPIGNGAISFTMSCRLKTKKNLHRWRFFIIKLILIMVLNHLVS